jgi:hypothetical protein
MSHCSLVSRLAVEMMIQAPLRLAPTETWNRSSASSNTTASHLGSVPTTWRRTRQGRYAASGTT